jgi:signal transduction histidine kinase/FixJ family two-component response regulator
MPRETILVVDDDSRARSHCQAVLEAARWQVVAVSDLVGALAALNDDRRLREQCELVLTEHILPQGNGFELFRALRREVPDLAGILMSGHTSLAVAVEALNIGFSQVLAKPLDSFHLTEAVEAALAERRTRRENARLQTLTRIHEALGELAALHDSEELYRCIVRLAVAETSADAASLMLLDPTGRHLWVAAAEGLPERVVRQAAKLVGEPVSGWVVHSGVGLDLSPGRPLPQVVRRALRRPEVSAALCLPLAFAERPVGVLNISRLATDLTFRPGDVEIATVLATDAALTIQRLALLQNQARREQVTTVGRLASTIIHDLRGPVTIIRGAAELLEDDAPAQHAALADIQSQVGELDRMCEQLLSFARETSALAFDEFALTDLVADLQAGGDVCCQAAGIMLDCRCEADAQVEAARAELCRAVLQLLETACQTASAGSRVTVWARLDGREVELQMLGTDTDPTRWQAQLDAPAAFAAGGTGLSLALARHVVERHHGRLAVEVGDTGYTLRLRWPQRQAA